MTHSTPPPFPRAITKTDVACGVQTVITLFWQSVFYYYYARTHARTLGRPTLALDTQRLNRYRTIRDLKKN